MRGDEMVSRGEDVLDMNWNWNWGDMEESL